jgi:hypothetical protein
MPTNEEIILEIACLDRIIPALEEGLHKSKTPQDVVNVLKSVRERRQNWINQTTAIKT